MSSTNRGSLKKFIRRDGHVIGSEYTTGAKWGPPYPPEWAVGRNDITWHVDNPDSLLPECQTATLGPRDINYRKWLNAVHGISDELEFRDTEAPAFLREAPLGGVRLGDFEKGMANGQAIPEKDWDECRRLLALRRLIARALNTDDGRPNPNSNPEVARFDLTEIPAGVTFVAACGGDWVATAEAIADARSVLALSPVFVGYDVGTSLWLRLRRLLDKTHWPSAEIIVKRWPRELVEAACRDHGIFPGRGFAHLGERPLGDMSVSKVLIVLDGHNWSMSEVIGAVQLRGVANTRLYWAEDVDCGRGVARRGAFPLAADPFPTFIAAEALKSPAFLEAVASTTPVPSFSMTCFSTLARASAHPRRIIEIEPDELWRMASLEASPPLLIGGLPRASHPEVWDLIELPDKTARPTGWARRESASMRGSTGGPLFDLALARGRKLPPAAGFWGWYGSLPGKGGYRHVPADDKGWHAVHSLHPSERVLYPLEYVVLIAPADFSPVDFVYWRSVATRCIFCVGPAPGHATRDTTNPVHLLRVLGASHVEAGAPLVVSSPS